MPRTPDLTWMYDPRPVDRLRLTFSYDWASGDYRLTVAVTRHGQSSATVRSYPCRTVDDAEDLSSVVWSSISRDLPEPF